MPHPWDVDSDPGSGAETPVANVDVHHVAEAPAPRRHVWDDSSSQASEDEPIRRRRGRPKKLPRADDRRHGARAAAPRRRAESAPAAGKASAELSLTSNWKKFIPPVEGALAEVAHSCTSILQQTEPVQHKPIVKAVAKRSFDRERPRKLLGTDGEAEVLGYNNQSYVRSAFTHLGAAVWVIARCMWGGFVSWLLNLEDDNEIELLVCVTMLSSDETTLEVGHKIVSELASKLIAIADDRQPKKKRRLKAHIEKVGLKILQSELVVALGWRWTDSGRKEFVMTELPTKLQTGDKMTGANMCKMWDDTLEFPLSRFASTKIPVKADVNCSDRGRNNGRANRIQRHYNPSKLRLDDTGCCHHNIHLSVRFQFNIFQLLTSGSISFSLMQKNGGVPAEFRQSIVRILLKKANPRVGTLPPAPDHPFMVYRKHVFDALLPQTAAGGSRRAWLEECFKGDLISHQIDVFLPEMETDKVQPWLSDWADRASWALYPAALSTLQLGRWSKNIDPFKGQTLLDAVHRIKNPALTDYLERSGKSKSETAKSVAIVDGMPVFTALPHGEASQSALWAAMNQKTRVDCRKLAGMDLLTESMLLSVTATPVCHLVDKILGYDADDWNEKRHRDMILGEPIRYRILEAHTGEATAGFYADCKRLLFNQAAFDAIHPSLRSMTTRAMGFASISRLMCSVFFYVTMPWLTYPFKLFKLIAGAEDVDTLLHEFKQDCPFMWDTFAKGFFDRFESDAERKSDEALLLLVIIAFLWRMTMQRVECRHASLRRLLLAKGMTTMMEFGNLSADWVLMRQRLIENVTAKLQTASLNDNTPAEQGALEGPKPEIHRAGGPCRAFMSRWWSSERAKGITCLKERASEGHAEYRRIKAEAGSEWRELVEEGRRWTAAGGSGHVRGAAPSNDAGISDAFNEFDSLWQQMSGHAPEAPAAVGAGDAVELQLQLVAVERAEKARQSREEMENVRQDIVAYCAARASSCAGDKENPVPDVGLGSGYIPHPDIQVHRSESFDCGVCNWAPILSEHAQDVSSQLMNGKLLDEFWAKTNSMYLDKDAPAVAPEIEKPVPKHACFYAGFCCCAKGNLRMTVCELQAVMRRWFKKGTELLSVLQQGMIVLRIQCQPAGNLYLHLGHEDRLTWRVAFLKLLEDPDEWRQLRANALHLTALVGMQADEWMGMRNLWSALLGVDFEQEIRVICQCISIRGDFELERGLSADHILVEDIFPITDEVIWPGFAEFRRRMAAKDARAQKSSHKPKATPAPVGDGPAASPAVAGDAAPAPVLMDGACEDGDPGAVAHGDGVAFDEPVQAPSERGSDDDESLAALDDAAAILGFHSSDEEVEPPDDGKPPGDGGGCDGVPPALDPVPVVPGAGPAGPAPATPTPDPGRCGAVDADTPKGEGESPSDQDSSDSESSSDSSSSSSKSSASKNKSGANGPKHEWPVIATVYSQDGSALCGYIKYSKDREMMVAYCVWRDPSKPDGLPDGEGWGTHGVCRLYRNTIRDPDQKRAWAGRPLSFLVAWLQLAHTAGDRPCHFDLHKFIDKPLRESTRRWIDSQGAVFEQALEAERPRRTGEPYEHVRNP